VASDTPTKHMYAKCLKCQARWWFMTLPTVMSNMPKKTVCPNCYEKKNVVIANEAERSEHKPERKE
jgi:hypothetical protein